MSDQDDYTPVVLAGDYADDDPQVLDSLVQPNAEPPAAVEKPVSDAAPMRQPRPTTRLLTQTSTLHTTAGAVQVFPGDADRQDLTLRVGPSAEAVHLRISDDSAKVASDMGALIAYPGDSWVGVLAGHTGPVWVQAARNDGDPFGVDIALVLSAVAVTK